MKTKIASIAAVGLLPIIGFAQSPPPPTSPAPGTGQFNTGPAPVAPVPPVPPLPPIPPDRDKAPKVPVTFIGVETSDVPTVVSEQLGLAKGFGLVVDYVVPDGPAAAAGVQQNDILKMLNDQILTEPDQLAKLVRSYPEGTTVILTVLRKGAEAKLTVKLAKREVSQHKRGWDKKWKGPDLGNLGEEMKGLQEELGKMNFGMIDGATDAAREAAREGIRLAREEGRRAREEGQRAREEGRRAREQQREEMRRARDEARRAAAEVRVVRRNDVNGTVKATTIDLGKATIVYHDAQGEMKIETVSGKKVLTAKDPEGRLLFSGPVGTQEELDKVPAPVRQRYDKLEQKDLPAVTPQLTADDEDADEDADEEDDDSDSESVEVQQVSCPKSQSFPYRRLGINTVMI